MGIADVQHVVFTKHTFIEIGTRGEDGTEVDVRKIQSWGCPRTPDSLKLAPGDDVSSISSDSTCERETDESVWSEESSDDWIADVCHLKTADPDDVERTSVSPWFVARHMNNVLPAQMDGSIMLRWMSCFDGAPVGAYLATSEPVQTTAEKHPFWSSWKISESAKTALKDRGATSRKNVEALQTSSGLCRRADRETPLVVKGAPSDRTFRMVRNIPNDYTRQDFVDLLDSKCVQYNFIYLPFDWKKQSNLGYAFVNLDSHAEAVRFAEALNG